MFAVDTSGNAEHIGDRFVGAAAVADEITRRLMPNELSRDMAEYIRDISKHGNYYDKVMLFGGAKPLGLDAIARTDGSLHLELSDCYGQRIWQISLRPAA